jgi:hypothetical protein
MSRRVVTAAVVACAVFGLAACTSSGSTHVQSFSPSPSDPPTTTSTGPAPSSSPPSTSSSSPSTSSGSGVATPTVTPPAQKAVNAYITFVNANDAAALDPAHANLAEVNKYLSGSALKVIDGSFQAMKSAGQAYRGSPPNPRVKVQSVLSSSFVILTSCPLENPTNPSVEYFTATGKLVPVPTRSPPPPYRLTLPMKLTNGQWQLTDILQNAGKTCTG